MDWKHYIERKLSSSKKNLHSQMLLKQTSTTQLIQKEGGWVPHELTEANIERRLMFCVSTEPENGIQL